MKPDPAAGDAGSQGAAANRPDAYLLAGQDVFERYGTRPGGLTAGEVASQRDRYGDNVIVEVVRELAVLGYLRQFKDWMIVLLLACAAITAYLGDILIASVLLALVLLNTLIGFVQEYRAGRTMASLERLVEPSSQVVRDGAIVVVPSHELVIGDVVRLEAGASVPADIRLVETSAFSTNEFALTGESDPTRKHSRAIVHAVPVADRRNMAYAGTTVATGEGLGVVVGTGRGTELGRIAHLSQSAPRVASPMQREIGHIARFITVVAVALALALLVVAVWFELPFREALLFAVGFATAVIPQGLPAEISTSLAQAAGGLARRGALVKKLSAVETLGATHVICTDKTGTLTENEMTVTELVAAGRSFVVSGTGYEPVGEIVPVGEGEALDDGAVGDVRALLTSAVLASNAQLMAPDADHVGWWVLGDPTEGALVVAARKAGLDGSGSSPAEVREHPFDSSRKLMSSVRVDGDRLVAYVKGAPESVVHAATHIADARGVRAITDADRTSFLDGHIEKSGRGLRNLAIAKRELTADEAGRDEPSAVERDLVLLGLVSMTDPLRAAVPEAMAAALGAQIRVDVITGDYSRTAEAIARQAGLEGVAGLRTVTGTELAAMSDDEVLDLALAGGTVFSRVDPEDKTRIVDLVRRSGRVVAVTGDGINDAPALRHASIGVAMGATGTDVAKDAADVVLLDDSFSTLVTAIRYGRVIYGNITKGIVACLTSNTAELFVNLASLALFALAGVPFAINVLQILAIDLLGELFPIAALGRDPEQEDTMRRPPREPRRRILRGRTIGDIVYAGGVIGALAIGNYLLAYLRVGIDPFGGVSDAAVIAYATTVTYTTILVCQFANIVQRRSHHGLFSRYQLSNPVFWLACALGVSVMLVIVYVPVVSRAFGTAPLGLEDWALVVAAAAIFLVVREVGRIVRGGVRPHPV